MPLLVKRLPQIEKTNRDNFYEKKVIAENYATLALPYLAVLVEYQ